MKNLLFGALVLLMGTFAFANTEIAEDMRTFVLANTEISENINKYSISEDSKSDFCSRSADAFMNYLEVEYGYLSSHELISVRDALYYHCLAN